MLVALLNRATLMCDPSVVDNVVRIFLCSRAKSPVMRVGMRGNEDIDEGFLCFLHQLSLFARSIGSFYTARRASWVLRKNSPPAMLMA